MIRNEQVLTDLLGVSPPNLLEIMYSDHYWSSAHWPFRRPLPKLLEKKYCDQYRTSAHRPFRLLFPNNLETMYCDKYWASAHWPFMTPPPKLLDILYFGIPLPKCLGIMYCGSILRKLPLTCIEQVHHWSLRMSRNVPTEMFLLGSGKWWPMISWEPWLEPMYPFLLCARNWWGQWWCWSRASGLGHRNNHQLLQADGPEPDQTPFSPSSRGGLGPAMGPGGPADRSRLSSPPTSRWSGQGWMCSWRSQALGV